MPAKPTGRIFAAGAAESYLKTHTAIRVKMVQMGIIFQRCRIFVMMIPDIPEVYSFGLFTFHLNRGRIFFIFDF